MARENEALAALLDQAADQVTRDWLQQAGTQGSGSQHATQTEVNELVRAVRWA